jgi:GTP cyclohydrolase I
MFFHSLEMFLLSPKCCYSLESRKESLVMMDYEKIKAGVRLMLEGIGEDVNREGLLETPDRIARMCAEIYGGLYEDPAQHLRKQFTVERDDMVIEKDITFYSTCEHHLLPFYGKAHIGYLPNGKVVGLSKLARTVDIYARRPQIQEKMTADIARALEEHLNPRGVIVMVEAEHTCMTMRGIKKPGSKTVTLVATGVFEENMELQNRFLSMVRDR